MKRMHVHIGVADIDASVAFYSELFAAEPSVLKADYAKWMLDDPRVNFSVTQGHAANGVEHLGIEAENAGELTEIYARLDRTGAKVLDEGRTNCCYARTDKSWTADPDGVLWETFHTHGSTEEYGMHPTEKGLTPEAVGSDCQAS